MDHGHGGGDVSGGRYRSDVPTDNDLASLHRIVASIPEAVGRTILANGGLDPRPDSQVLREIAAQGPYVGRRQKPVLNAYSIALTRWLSAMQHLVDIARVLDGPAATHGTASLFRTTLENSAWAWWGMDPEIDAKRRIARGLSAEIASLNEVILFPFETMQAEATSIRDLIASEAEALGFFVQRATDGSPRWVEEKPPTITRLLDSQLGEPGTVAYRELSAVAHGTVFALLYRMKRVDLPSTTDGMTTMEPSVPLDSLGLGITIALDSFWQATDRRFCLYGYDARDWNRFVLESKKLLLPLLRS
jgi:hypothetical protein